MRAHSDGEPPATADTLGIWHALYLHVMFKDVVGLTSVAYRKKFGNQLADRTENGDGGD